MIIKYLLINIFILLCNLYFYNYFYFGIKLKNVDKLFLNLCCKSFFQISNYLNSKYLNRCNTSNDIKQLNKKNISIYFIEFHGTNFDKNEINKIINILKKKYVIYIEPNNPDYLIFNIFGCNHLDIKYNNSIKIGYLTENQIPDFNTADYFIGHCHINYLDRYFKLPIYFYNSLINLKYKEIEKIREAILKKPIRKKFCAALISNNLITDGFRINFINELSKYKAVDMGGRFNNSIGRFIENKIKFLTSYKFSIAMENTEGDGYVSEKIIESFLSGTIPIYYGDYMIDEYINPDSYILIKGEKDLKKKIEYIKEIDNNVELYKKIISKKILLNKYQIKNEYKKSFIEFFENIIFQNKNIAKRIDYLSL